MIHRNEDYFHCTEDTGAVEVYCHIETILGLAYLQRVQQLGVLHAADGAADLHEDNSAL